MSSIRHRNLVKVITSCSNLDFKALVLAYIPNGDLDKWLYSPELSLTFVQRLGIMIDVASAIEYLHLGYSFPIVHCDLKPSNILMDEDMIAYVGDFGIAKLLTEEQRMEQTKTLGTIGYMAPEYGSTGTVSTMSDVYSYGILLMETFTGKKPTDEMFSAELTLKKWVSESFRGDIMQIVNNPLLNSDGEIGISKYEKCLIISILQVALECVTEIPNLRLKMNDVVSKLQKIKTEFLP
ncbi:probable LRR receptor-like serine/threonine-protein kinase At3g47570 [Henckelia pumila]|uniref:probable LRR receptor-like serine/threonine-protein kinase At3g47570 n=1 Tax=Henckelia pumila TaxID=405737 RepID=UPI003C6E89B7